MARGIVIALLALAVVRLAAAGPPPDAVTILREAEKLRNPEIDFTVDFKLAIINPRSSWKERTAHYTLIAHGKDHSLVLMREPPNLYPGLMLIAEGVYWLLLPRSNHAFQLSPRHILNGDVSNGDLTRGNLQALYATQFDGEERIDGEDCWRLELTRTGELGLYPRIRCWITKQQFRPLKFEYIGETGTLQRVARYEDYRDGPTGVRAMRVVVDDPVAEQQTVMTFTNLRKLDASAMAFTREALPALRNAALAKWEADGVQARPEDILEAIRARNP